jgi:hypothetical protein
VWATGPFSAPCSRSVIVHRVSPLLCIALAWDIETVNIHNTINAVSRWQANRELWINGSNWRQSWSFWVPESFLPLLCCFITTPNGSQFCYLLLAHATLRNRWCGLQLLTIFLTLIFKNVNTNSNVWSETFRSSFTGRIKKLSLAVVWSYLARTSCPKLRPL